MGKECKYFALKEVGKTIYIYNNTLKTHENNEKKNVTQTNVREPTDFQLCVSM